MRLDVTRRGFSARCGEHGVELKGFPYVMLDFAMTNSLMFDLDAGCWCPTAGPPHFGRYGEDLPDSPMAPCRDSWRIWMGEVVHCACGCVDCSKCKGTCGMDGVTCPDGKCLGEVTP